MLPIHHLLDNLLPIHHLLDHTAKNQPRVTKHQRKGPRHTSVRMHTGERPMLLGAGLKYEEQLRVNNHGSSETWIWDSEEEHQFQRAYPHGVWSTSFYPKSSDILRRVNDFPQCCCDTDKSALWQTLVHRWGYSTSCTHLNLSNDFTGS